MFVCSPWNQIKSSSYLVLLTFCEFFFYIYIMKVARFSLWLPAYFFVKKNPMKFFASYMLDPLSYVLVQVRRRISMKVAAKGQCN